MLTCKVCVGAGSGEVVSGLVLESGMGLGVCVLRDRGGPSHDPDYPELPTGHHRDVALTPQESETREAQLGSMGSWWRMPKHLLSLQSFGQMVLGRANQGHRFPQGRGSMCK